MIELEWRPAFPQDLTTVAGWITSSSELERWAGPGLVWPLDTERLWRDIDAGAIPSYCFKCHGDPVAFGQLSPKGPRHHHLARLIVAPTRRGEGLGRKLCEKLIEEARLRGAARLTLNVFSDNAPALALYRHLGFRLDGVRDDRGVVPMVCTLFADAFDNPDNDAQSE